MQKKTAAASKAGFNGVLARISALNQYDTLLVALEKAGEEVNELDNARRNLITKAVVIPRGAENDKEFVLTVESEGWEIRFVVNHDPRNLNNDTVGEGIDGFRRMDGSEPREMYQPERQDSRAGAWRDFNKKGVSIMEFHILAKPIGPICNLDCKYCFYLEKEQLYPQVDKWAMREDVLESFIRQYVETHDTAVVSFA